MAHAFLKSVCVMFYLQIGLCTMYVLNVQRPEEGTGSPKTGVNWCVWITMWVQEIKKIPLSTEPSLQPEEVISNIYWLITFLVITIFF